MARLSVIWRQESYATVGVSAPWISDVLSISDEGVLQVLDPTLMLSLLENGIGPAKAFGCGMMLVRRV